MWCSRAIGRSPWTLVQCPWRFCNSIWYHVFTVCACSFPISPSIDSPCLRCPVRYLLAHYFYTIVFTGCAQRSSQMLWGVTNIHTTPSCTLVGIQSGTLSYWGSYSYPNRHHCYWSLSCWGSNIVLISHPLFLKCIIHPIFFILYCRIRNGGERAKGWGVSGRDTCLFASNSRNRRFYGHYFSRLCQRWGLITNISLTSPRRCTDLLMRLWFWWWHPMRWLSPLRG